MSKAWTGKEEKDVVRWAANGATIHEMANKLGRTYKAVETRLQVLKVNKASAKGIPFKDRKRLRAQANLQMEIRAAKMEMRTAPLLDQHKPLEW